MVEELIPVTWSAEARAHIFDRIFAVETNLTLLVAERDRQYQARSQAQDKAVVDALVAQKEAVAAALAAQLLAADKAEVNTKLMIEGLTTKVEDGFARIDLNISTLTSGASTVNGRREGLSAVGGWIIGSIAGISLIITAIRTATGH